MLRSDVPIALPYEYVVGYNAANGLVLTATGDKGYFVVPFRCQVIMAGAVVTTTCAGGSSTPIVKFDKRPTAGSDTDRGDGDIATLVLGTTAAGKVMYDLAAIGTVLEPGQEVVVEVTTAATGGGAAGYIRPFLNVEYLPETAANLSALVETA